MDVTIREGITDKQINELVQYAQNDIVIHRFTSDKDRFKNKEHFLKWRNDDVKIFVMTDHSEHLLGIIWFQPLSLPDADYTKKLNKDNYAYTFGMRIYAEARGKGLAKDFLAVVLKKVEYRRLWLRTSEDNHAAIKTYEYAGFKAVSSPDQNNKIIMIRSAS